jgi:hypothetical protein
MDDGVELAGLEVDALALDAETASATTWDRAGSEQVPSRRLGRLDFPATEPSDVDQQAAEDVRKISVQGRVALG